MRADMAEVIHEGRHRRWAPRKSKGSRRKLARLGPDNLPICEGIQAHLSQRYRMGFNDRRAPLKRFLNSHLGRPWDTVHAEICAHLSLDSDVQRSVRLSLDALVLTNVIVIDGVPCCGEGSYCFGSPVNSRRIRWSFYVCPHSGLLRRATPEPRRRRRRQRQRSFPSILPPIGLGRLRQYHFLNGHWCEVRLQRFEPLGPWPSRHPGCSPARDVVLDERLSADVAQARYGLVAYAIAVRALGRSERASLPLPTPPAAGGRLPNIVR